MPPSLNFLPGPTGVHPDVLAAMSAPMFAHYGPRMTPILTDLQPALQAMLGTSRPVFTVTTSGTGLMEAAIRNAVRRRVLVVVSGFFGEYFARIAERCGKDVVRVHVPFGHTLEAEQLRTFFDGPPVDSVALVHSESSTGALAPLDALARVVHEQDDVMLLVDGVSSAGGLPIEMDRIGVDFMVTGSQKALAVPPGLAVGAVSERLERRAATMPDAGHYFSVTRWVVLAREHQLFETPALPVFFALHRQLGRIASTGGWPARWARHRHLAARFHEWASHMAGRLELVAPEGRRSPTVSVIRLTQGQDPAAIHQALDERGFMIGMGIEPWHGPILRIGHMGEVDLPDLERLLDALEPLL